MQFNISAANFNRIIKVCGKAVATERASVAESSKYVQLVSDGEQLTAHGSNTYQICTVTVPLLDPDNTAGLMYLPAAALALKIPAKNIAPVILSVQDSTLSIRHQGSSWAFPTICPDMPVDFSLFYSAEAKKPVALDITLSVANLKTLINALADSKYLRFEFRDPLRGLLVFGDRDSKALILPVRTNK